MVVGIEPGLFYWPNDELHGLSLWQSEGPAEETLPVSSREPLLLLLWDTRTLRDTQNNLVERL